MKYNTNNECRKKTHSRVEIAEGIDIAKVLGRMFVRLLEATMVIIDDWIKDFGEKCVRLGIGRINTDAGIMVFQTRLDNIQESGTERGLPGLELIKDLLR